MPAPRQWRWKYIEHNWLEVRYDHSMLSEVREQPRALRASLKLASLPQGGDSKDTDLGEPGFAGGWLGTSVTYCPQSPAVFQQRDQTCCPSQLRGRQPGRDWLLGLEIDHTASFHSWALSGFISCRPLWPAAYYGTAVVWVLHGLSKPNVIKICFIRSHLCK